MSAAFLCVLRVLRGRTNQFTTEDTKDAEKTATSSWEYSGRNDLVPPPTGTPATAKSFPHPCAESRSRDPRQPHPPPPSHTHIRVRTARRLPPCTMPSRRPSRAALRHPSRSQSSPSPPQQLQAK